WSVPAIATAIAVPAMAASVEYVFDFNYYQFHPTEGDIQFQTRFSWNGTEQFNEGTPVKGTVAASQLIVSVLDSSGSEPAANVEVSVVIIDVNTGLVADLGLPTIPTTTDENGYIIAEDTFFSASAPSGTYIFRVTLTATGTSYDTLPWTLT
ncbi:MAG: hypothetical protein QM632_03280, partial [Micrococcaceae bacterium]